MEFSLALYRFQKSFRQSEQEVFRVFYAELISITRTTYDGTKCTSNILRQGMILENLVKLETHKKQFPQNAMFKSLT